MDEVKTNVFDEDRLMVAKAIYGAMPITRFLSHQSCGVPGHYIPSAVGFIVPVPWDEMPTFDQERFLRAADAVQHAQLAGILADAEEGEKAYRRALTEHGTRESRSRIYRERLQAIVDWADLAHSASHEFADHGLGLLRGPVFDDAREALAVNPAIPVLVDE